MCKHFSYLLLILVISAVATFSVSACDATGSCDKCAKDSEFSWNPENKYVTTQLSRFYALDHEIELAYKAGDAAKTKALANENLDLAKVYRCNWNYGNAIHDSNRFLGLLSLKSGELDNAADYLLRSGKTTGSPQLNSFGPTLDLANELLKQGKREAVTAYLGDIQSFWKMNGGLVEEWLAEIKNGETPELGRITRREPSALENVWWWFTLLWPLIVSAVVLYWQKQKISRKLLFFVVSASASYISVLIAGAIGGGVFVLFVNSLAAKLAFTYFLSGVTLLLPLAVVFLIWKRFSNVRGISADPSINPDAAL